jgi:hypothetical protein
MSFVHGLLQRIILDDSSWEARTPHSGIPGQPPHANRPLRRILGRAQLAVNALVDKMRLGVDFFATERRLVAQQQGKFNFCGGKMKRISHISLMALVLAIAACLGSTGSAFAQATKDPANASQAFDKLKTLARHWEATTEKGKVTTSFELVSGGTALVEHMSMASEKEMLTVYFVDGNRLLLTHYCEAGNQPRMQAAAFDPKSSVIDFGFLDATNMPDANAGHMHHVTVRLNGPSELAEDWTFYQGGKASMTVPILYHRVD